VLVLAVESSIFNSTWILSPSAAA